MKIRSSGMKLVSLAFAVWLTGCTQDQDGAAAEALIPDARGEETQGSDRGGAPESAAFYPIYGIVPAGRVEAQNVVAGDDSTEYRQLLEVGEGLRYVEDFSLGAEQSGFVKEEVSPDHYRFSRAGHQIELRLLSSASVNGGTKAHVVWRVDSLSSQAAGRQ